MKFGSYYRIKRVPHYEGISYSPRTIYYEGKECKFFSYEDAYKMLNKIKEMDGDCDLDCIAPRYEIFEYRGYMFE